MNQPLVVPGDFWDHGPVRQALAQRHLGRVIRAYRHHPYHGREPLPQHTVARWLGITQAQLSRVENGLPIVNLDKLIYWSGLLRIPPALLWFKPRDEPGPADTVDHHPSGHPPTREMAVPPSATVAGPGTDDGGDPVKRRTLFIATALASLGVNEQLGSFITAEHPPVRIGPEHLAPVREAIAGFERADAALGGDDLYHVAVALHRKVVQWERECAYDRHLRGSIQATLGDLECWIGWFALDSERRPESRHHLTEAIVRARLTDDPQLEVRALQSMSMLLRETHPQEALHCAEAGQRMAAGWATPRLSTLLHLRAARAHAESGDPTGFQREMSKALTAFDRGEHDNDPLYIRFVQHGEVTGTEAYGQLKLGNSARAVSSFQSLYDNPDPGYRRNQILRAVHLARAKMLHGDLDSASQLALDAVPAVAAIHSRRTKKLLSGLRGELGRHAARSTLARRFTTAYDETVS